MVPVFFPSRTGHSLWISLSSRAVWFDLLGGRHLHFLIGDFAPSWSYGAFVGFFFSFFFFFESFRGDLFFDSRDVMFFFPESWFFLFFFFFAQIFFVGCVVTLDNSVSPC